MIERQNLSSWITKDMIKKSEGLSKEPCKPCEMLCSVNLDTFSVALYAVFYSYVNPQDLRFRRNLETVSILF